MRRDLTHRRGVCLADEEVGPNAVIDDQAGLPGLETRIQMDLRPAAHDPVGGIEYKCAHRPWVWSSAFRLPAEFVLDQVELRRQNANLFLPEPLEFARLFSEQSLMSQRRTQVHENMVPGLE